MLIPDSFRQMPRWWHDGPEWLDGLPDLARTMCARWNLRIAGSSAHGSNALVVPVTRDGGLYVLRLTPPGPDVGEQVAALTFWNGRGTVELVDADLEAGAMLLERLTGSLLEAPADEAMTVLGAMMKRLAIPAPAHAVTTDEVVTARLETMVREWHGLAGPFDGSFLRQALDAGDRVRDSQEKLAVNGDLHSAQILRGTREPWLAVDPVLMRGDPAYDLARVLWTRLDDMRDVEAHFGLATKAAGLARDHARDWVVYRTVDYWLWGLGVGLTEDPERCRRLLRTFAG